MAQASFSLGMNVRWGQQRLLSSGGKALSLLHCVMSADSSWKQAKVTVLLPFKQTVI
jgi:hypothetical protein